MKIHNPKMGSAEPLTTDSAMVFVTQPAPLAPVHPLRRTRCRICGTLIGGQHVRLVTLAISDEPECICGTLPVWTWVICTAHPATDVAALARDCSLAAETVHRGAPC